MADAEETIARLVVDSGVVLVDVGLPLVERLDDPATAYGMVFEEDSSDIDFASAGLYMPPAHSWAGQEISAGLARLIDVGDQAVGPGNS